MVIDNHHEKQPCNASMRQIREKDTRGTPLKPRRKRTLGPCTRQLSGSRDGAGKDDRKKQCACSREAGKRCRRKFWFFFFLLSYLYFSTHTFHATSTPPVVYTHTHNSIITYCNTCIPSSNSNALRWWENSERNLFCIIIIIFIYIHIYNIFTLYSYVCLWNQGDNKPKPHNI